MKTSKSKLKSPRVKKKLQYKLQMNEHEKSFYVNINDFKLYNLSLQLENKK